MELLPKLFRRRLATEFAKHQPPRPDDFVEGLNHVNRHTDSARLIVERAADCLPNPPGCVGRELVAAPVFELVDRPHQADVPFLNQVEELQAAVGVFPCYRDDETQVRLHHLLLCLQCLPLALLHRVHDLTELPDFKASLARQCVDLRTKVPDNVLVASDEVLPAYGGEFRYSV